MRAASERWLRRIDLVQPRTEDGESPPARFQSCLMRQPIDAARHARNDDHPVACQVPPEVAGNACPVRTRLARSHDRHSPAVTGFDRPPHVQHRRRLSDFPQSIRVPLVEPREHRVAGLAYALCLARWIDPGPALYERRAAAGPISEPRSASVEACHAASIEPKASSKTRNRTAPIPLTRLNASQCSFSSPMAPPPPRPIGENTTPLPGVSSRPGCAYPSCAASPRAG